MRKKPSTIAKISRLPKTIFLIIFLMILLALIPFSQKGEFKNKKVAESSIKGTSISLTTPSPSPASSDAGSPRVETGLGGLSPSSQPQVQVASAQISGFCLNVPTLLYHHIEPIAQAQQEGHAWLTVDVATFDKQMAYLVSRSYSTISADTLAQALITHQKLPKSVVLTFDDGYRDFYTNAYPIIRKYNLTANLMIPTGLLENSSYLTWSQLKEITGSGLVFAYDHTWSHSSLPKDSKDKAQFEILTAKKQLESNLGKPVNIFAYPYGSENGAAIDLLRSDGFIAAFSTIGGFTQCNSFIMSLHRNRISNSPLSSFGL